MTERRDVADTYDRIAGHFAATREYAWPEVESFVAGRDVDVALDVGCGNGRHAETLAGVARRVVALDASRGILQEAASRAADREVDLDLLTGDASRLPIASDTVDLAVYVATIHHLPSRAARVESLREVARVLDPDHGVALVSAWSTAHDRFDADEGFDTTVDWTLPGGETVPRYYHIYSLDEFRADLEAAAVCIQHLETSSGNCYAAVCPEGKRP